MTWLARAERRAGVTPAGLVVAALIPPCFVLAGGLGNRSVFLLGYAAVGVLALSRVLARRRLALTAGRSTLPGRLRVGQSVDVTLVVTAGRRLATVVLEEDLPDGLGSPVRVAVPVLPAGESVQHGYRLAAQRRGVYQVGPLVAEWSDPFGLTRRRVPIADSQTVVVHPVVERVHDRVTSREWEDPPVRPPRSMPWPSGFEFYGMRDYVAGDDPRRIVWSASARTEDRYLVRESEQGITDRVVLVLDSDASRHSPGRPSETFERAVSAVASLASRHLGDGLSVTVDTNGARLATALRGSGSRIALLDQLAAVGPEPARLEAALDRLFLDRARNIHTVLVTPYLSDSAARRVTLRLQRGGSVLLALVLGELTDPAMLHRAGVLDCPVVELIPGASLERCLRRVMVGGRR